MSLLTELANSHIQYAKLVCDILHQIACARKAHEQSLLVLLPCTIPDFCYVGGENLEEVTNNGITGQIRWNVVPILMDGHKWGSAAIAVDYIKRPNDVVRMSMDRPEGDPVEGFCVTYCIPQIADINHVYGKPHLVVGTEKMFIPDTVFLSVLEEFGLVLDTDQKQRLLDIMSSDTIKKWVEHDCDEIRALIKYRLDTIENFGLPRAEDKRLILD